MLEGKEPPSLINRVSFGVFLSHDSPAIQLQASHGLDLWQTVDVTACKPTSRLESGDEGRICGCQLFAERLIFGRYSDNIYPFAEPPLLLMEVSIEFETNTVAAAVGFVFLGYGIPLWPGPAIYAASGKLSSHAWASFIRITGFPPILRGVISLAATNS